MTAIFESPRVSVLMTVFNAANFLERSLRSIFDQTFEDFELVVVENGSTDGSRAILKKYQDERLRILALPNNIGRTPALRLAMEQARGDMIAILDADDISLPDRLDRQITFLGSHPEVVLVGTWADFIDFDGRIVGHHRPSGSHDALIDILGSANPIVHSSAMFRADDARAVGGYPEQYAHSQDLGLWLRLLGRGRVAVIEESLCEFRINTGGMTTGGRYRLDAARDQLDLLTQMRVLLPFSASGRARNREELAIARIKYALALTQGGGLIGAAGQLLRALFLDPSALVRNRVTRSLFRR